MARRAALQDLYRVRGRRRDIAIMLLRKAGSVEASGPSDQNVDLSGLGFVNASQFGALSIDQDVSVSGLNASAQFGTPTLDAPVVEVLLTGFVVSAQFGGETLDVEVASGSISNPAQFGAPRIDTLVTLLGIDSSAQFGSISILSTSDVLVTGFQVPAEFGTFTPDQEVILAGFLNSLAFGSITIFREGDIEPSTTPQRTTLGVGT